MGFDSNWSGSDPTHLEVEEDPLLATWIDNVVFCYILILEIVVFGSNFILNKNNKI